VILERLDEVPAGPRWLDWACLAVLFPVTTAGVIASFPAVSLNPGEHWNRVLVMVVVFGLGLLWLAGLIAWAALLLSACLHSLWTRVWRAGG
jgi:hypothetical protein